MVTYKKCFLAFMYLIAIDSDRKVLRRAYKPITKEINVPFLYMILNRSDTKLLYNFYSMKEKDINAFYFAENTILIPSWLDILFKHSSIPIRKSMLHFFIEKIYPIEEYKPPIMDMTSTAAKQRLTHSTEIEHTPRAPTPSEIAKKQNSEKVTKKKNVPKSAWKPGKWQKAKKNEGGSVKSSSIKKVKFVKEELPSKKRLAKIIKSAFTASFISSDKGFCVYSEERLLENFVILMPHVDTKIEAGNFIFSEKEGPAKDAFVIPKGFKLV